MISKTNITNDLSEAAVPGLLRRLGAIFYDALLLTALVFVATAIVTLPFGNPSGNWLLIFQLFVFEIIPLLFFVGFWVWGGQTLGMRAWRLKLVRMDGRPVGWGDALKRHFAAILSILSIGLGFIWIVFDPEKMAWHDKLSQTRLVLLEK
ncbi:MAG: RDD family protein [Candidatus Thiodiazotropha sp. DIVDIV]